MYTLTSAAVVLGQNDDLGLAGSSDFLLFLLFSLGQKDCVACRGSSLLVVSATAESVGTITFERANVQR